MVLSRLLALEQLSPADAGVRKVALYAWQPGGQQAEQELPTQGESGSARPYAAAVYARQRPDYQAPPRPGPETEGASPGTSDSIGIAKVELSRWLRS